MNADEVEHLVLELLDLPRETEWVEFKRNNADPHDVGAYVSALSNSAALLDRPRGVIVWGIDNATRKVVGTSFRPYTTKIGNEDLEGWLTRLLSPRLDFRIHEAEVKGEPVVVLEIPAAIHTPVRFRSEEYIRIGSYKKKLKDHPEKERALWAVLSRTVFEDGVAGASRSGDEVLQLLDYPRYFELAELPLPQGRDGILNRLLDEKFIIRAGKGKYSITNLGGILFARNLDQLGLGRKACGSSSIKGPTASKPSASSQAAVATPPGSKV